MSEIVVRGAEPFETEAVAGLRWRWVVERGGVPVVTREEFVASMLTFAAEHERTHHRVVAVRSGIVVGMAWLAVLPRVPSPRATRRASGDVQCVYVVPEERNANIGSKLMDAILDKARQLTSSTSLFTQAQRPFASTNATGSQLLPDSCSLISPVTERPSGQQEARRTSEAAVSRSRRRRRPGMHR